MARQSAGDAAEQSAQEARLTGRQVVEEFLNELAAVRATGAGVPETSYYPALSNLFNAAGAVLRPKVRCVIHPRDVGAGIPNGGLFTADQFQQQTDARPDAEQLPARGAIEVKAPDRDVRDIADSPQVRGYLGRYGIVIVTNLRAYLVLERGPDGRAAERESFTLAPDEDTFWEEVVAHPRATAQQIGDQFFEFILRAGLHAAPLVNPKDVAWFLASYARDALARVERRKELPALRQVRTALEEALGMEFTGDRGEHFFRSTLVQTLFYGVFSAWVLWHRANPAGRARFEWKSAEWSLHVPFIRTLYEEVAKPSRLGPLELVEVLDWAAGVLNRVDRDGFFQRFQDGSAVQYFYEPFLEAYDPELRKALGVWYTPPEIVQYQVARVDMVLREELGVADGLADPNVIVLDPCCGTGAYLVEVLKQIERNLRAKNHDALLGHDVKNAALTRVFGFEILPAPFVIAHLQLGLLLQRMGLPLALEKAERVGVYLTNALTGWEPPREGQQRVMAWVELQEERDAAARVKREHKILVVLGNPPYNAFTGVSPKEEQGLVEPYKKGLNTPTGAGGWGIKKFNLDDLYVRFFRVAERRIAEMTGQGVVSFISNFSYLGDPSFVVMRRRFLAEFDKLWLDCMNGDSRETGKLTPEGWPDPSVFSTEYNREGIRVGTAVCVLVRRPDRGKRPVVRFRHFWGAAKRAELLDSLRRKRFDAAYTLARPKPENRFSFRPENVAAHYTRWPRMTELCEVAPSNGLMEKRGGALVDIDRDRLAARMRDYFDAALPWEEYKARHKGLAKNAARFKAHDARKKAYKTEEFDARRLRRYAVRPFDTRWCYYTPVRPVWNEPRPALWRQCFKGNAFILSRPAGVASPEGVPFSFTRCLGDNDYQRGHSYYFPLRVRDGKAAARGENHLFDNGEPHANLSRRARSYLATLCIKDPDADAKLAGLIWLHALAIGYSPAYLTENADGIRRDWPRIPLPDDRPRLEASAALGERVAALLDTEADVPGITRGKLTPAIKTFGVVTKVGGTAADPNTRDFAVTAGWGHAGKGGVTMPAKGKLVVRPFTEEERRAIDAEAGELGLPPRQVPRLLGGQTCDVYLNAAVYWRNVPRAVWEYHIGGYQVLKKWLSYREEELLGRPLTPEEVREFTGIVRRLAAIILLQPALDENYARVKVGTYAWPGGGEPM